MAFTAFSGLTGTIANLNAYFTQLYLLRELISDPGYTAATPRVTIDGSGNFNFAQQVGIGGTPIAPLYVNAQAAQLAGVMNSANATGPYLRFDRSGTAVGDIGTGAALVSAGGVNDFGINVRGAANLILGANGVAGLSMDGTSRHIAAGADNSQTLGTAAKRWSTVYAGTGTINTSDAREKTTVSPLTAAEIEAAKQIAREVGSFQFLSAIASKGREARLHIGMTVQRAMDILNEQGLDPHRYAFICHDEWPAQTLQHAAVMQPHESLVDQRGQPIQVEVKPAWAETVPAGDRYGFRADELLLFIARGQEARLAALESAA